MLIKYLGAGMVVVGCGWTGFRISASHRKETRMLKELISLLEYMECELRYRLTPLPQLCRKASEISGGMLGCVFMALAEELENQISPDAAYCMRTVLGKETALKNICRDLLLTLGQTLGSFDLEGQLSGLEAVRQECGRELKARQENQDVRLRSYQTLGVCAGAALAILLI